MVKETSDSGGKASHGSHNSPSKLDISSEEGGNSTADNRVAVSEIGDAGALECA
jgi:hypothetical protein